ncbi:hypothetical protein Patl1_00460 [Pistacia atlantica]|uniref:Uncharacterized protein n=1 Tax=Pistacia atlantica TaxID=434234 RepID=A0ACC1CC02_9ROSI|nr:hypothetical protein Patl1_00460 [Pistacia atlantica]
MDMYYRLLSLCIPLYFLFTASLEVIQIFLTDSKGVRTSKNKKKHRRKKDQQKSASADETIKTHKQESNGLNSLCPCAEAGNEFRPDQGETSNMQDVEDDIFARKSEFDDGDVDDEIDPALKEKIDR